MDQFDKFDLEIFIVSLDDTDTRFGRLNMTSIQKTKAIFHTSTTEQVCDMKSQSQYTTRRSFGLVVHFQPAQQRLTSSPKRMVYGTRFLEESMQSVMVGSQEMSIWLHQMKLMIQYLQISRGESDFSMRLSTAESKTSDVWGILSSNMASTTTKCALKQCVS